MRVRFEGTREEVEEVGRIVAEIPEIQRALVENHPALARADRAAHQQQIAGGRVVLDVARQLPAELDGLGVFVPGARAVGIGRISTGLGCPHLETDPDFLGLMLAFQTTTGRRVDFLAINDGGAPTDTVEEFLALLAATAHAAGTEVPFGAAGALDLGNLAVAQTRLFHVLRKRLGVIRATGIFLHLIRQTTRTARSSSAIQAYWTGVVEAGDVAGKFTFLPVDAVNEHRPLRPGGRYLTEDWERRWAAGDIVFIVRWIPFVNEEETPLENLSEAWTEANSASVGTVTFPRTDSSTHDARLAAMLASEMGANPGNWVSTREGEARREFPGTTFAAARQMAYAHSQVGRSVLPERAYQEFFTSGGVIGPDLSAELERRNVEQLRAGHGHAGAEARA